MIKIIKEWLKILSLSNPDNWELKNKIDWSYDPDGWTKPRNIYRHKKYNYVITNAYIKNPIHKIEVINKFIIDYKNKSLIFNECFYLISK